MAERTVLTWKCEDGPEDAPLEGSPDDVGPAWIDTVDGNMILSSEKANDGEWMTRAEAQQLAETNGYAFSADDGSPQPDEGDGSAWPDSAWPGEFA